MHPCVLPDIERLQMQPVGSCLEQQWVDQQRRQPGSAISEQAGTQQSQVRHQLFRFSVSR